MSGKLESSPFLMRENAIKHQRAEAPAPPPQAQAEEVTGPALKLAAKKRTKQTYTVYLDKSLMGRVKRVAERNGVPSSAVIEACLNATLPQME